MKRKLKVSAVLRTVEANLSPKADSRINSFKILSKPQIIICGKFSLSRKNRLRNKFRLMGLLRMRRVSYFLILIIFIDKVLEYMLQNHDSD